MIDIHNVNDNPDAPPFVLEYGGRQHVFQPPQKRWEKVRVKYVLGRIQNREGNATNRPQIETMVECWRPSQAKGPPPGSTRDNIQRMHENAKKAIKLRGNRCVTWVLEKVGDLKPDMSPEERWGVMMPGNDEFFVTEFEVETKGGRTTWHRVPPNEHWRVRKVLDLAEHIVPEDELHSYKGEEKLTTTQLAEKQAKELRDLERANELKAMELAAEKLGIPIDKLAGLVERERKAASK